MVWSLSIRAADACGNYETTLAPPLHGTASLGEPSICGGGMLSAAHDEIEVINVFSPAQSLIEGNRGGIVLIGLHVDHVGATVRGDALQFGNQTRGDALSPMFLRNGQIVDVDFAPVPLELLQLVGREASDDLAAASCDDRDEVTHG